MPRRTTRETCFKRRDIPIPEQCIAAGLSRMEKQFGIGNKEACHAIVDDVFSTIAEHCYQLADSTPVGPEHGLSSKTQVILEVRGITTIGHVMQLKSWDIRGIRFVGKKAWDEVSELQRRVEESRMVEVDGNG